MMKHYFLGFKNNCKWIKIKTLYFRYLKWKPYKDTFLDKIITKDTFLDMIIILEKYAEAYHIPNTMEQSKDWVECRPQAIRAKQVVLAFYDREGLAFYSRERLM